jgi:hypothetical protein
MGKKGPKASNIYQNPGIKNTPGNITNPSIVGIGSPLKQRDSGAVIGAAENKVTEIAGSDKKYKAKQRKTQRQIKKVDKVTGGKTSRKDRMSRAETLLEREGVVSPAKHAKRPVKHSYASHKKGSSEEYIAQLERTKWKKKKGDKSNVYKK